MHNWEYIHHYLKAHAKEQYDTKILMKLEEAHRKEIQATNNNNDNNKGEEKSRKDIKEPFWKNCNTAHLSSVLKHIFQPK
jgi:hypothetical protein